MSAATKEKPAAKSEDAPVAEREIRHELDVGLFRAFGFKNGYRVDLKDSVLKEEYFLYRDTFHGNGSLDSATVHRLVVEQLKRKGK